MNRPICFGIMGTGNIAHKFASAIPNAEGAKLLACASRTPGKAEKFSAEFNIPLYYDNYEALLANPDIDCIYISTTPNFHYENLKQCLKAGKHVICEKPLLSTSKYTKEIIDAFRQSDRFLMEAMWSRFLPATQKARAILRSGELGRLLHVESHFCCKCSPQNARLYNRELEGSVTTDMGIYNYDLTTFFTECEPDHIVTSPAILHGQTDIEGNILLHFPGDITAYMCCSYRFHGTNDMVLYCEKGKIHLTPYLANPEQVEVTYPDGQIIVYPYEYENGFEFEIMEAVRCIHAGLQQSDIHPWNATLHSAQFFDHVFSSWGNNWPDVH